MKKLLISVSCLLIFVLTSQAQSYTGSNYVSTAVPFLTITPDARAAGMGDIGVATEADINSIHWNLSKIAFAERKGAVSVSYTPWLKDIAQGMSVGYFSGYYKLGDNQAFSASFRFFNLGDIDIVDKDATKLKTSTPNEFAFDFGYARALSDNLSMAVAFRYIQSNIIEADKASAFAADISAFYKLPLTDSNIAFGANISNIGSKMTYNSSSYFIPTNLRIGSTYSRQITDDSKLSLSLDVNKLLVDGGEEAKINAQKGVISIGKESNENVFSSMISSLSDFSSITYSVGTEFTFQERFAARGGYFYENRDAGNRNYFTAGLGVNYNNINFDIAYLIATDSTNPLKNTLRFSVAYSF